MVDRRTLLCAFGLGLLVLSVYLLSGSSDLLHNGDTDLRYQTTESIVDSGHIWIAHPMYTDSRVARGVGGHLYAFYAPGQTVLMVPLYVVGKVLAHRLSLPYGITTLYAARSLDLWLGALLAVVFFYTALALGYTRRVATLLTLTFAFATVAWPDAQSALEQTQVDLFLLAAVLALMYWIRGARQRSLFVAGTGLGLAVFTRYDMVIYVLILGVFVAGLDWKRGRPGLIVRHWLVLASGVAPWIILVALWNLARFGSPFLTGLHQATFGEPPLYGLAALLVSPGKGFLWYLPLLLLLPVAAPAFYRRSGPVSVLFAALAGATLLFYANILYWHGDPAWGPRYLYVSVPYLILPLGMLYARWRRLPAITRLALVAVVAYSFILNAAAVSVNDWRFWYRLEAAEGKTSQPFQWGAPHYHYYWNVLQSPILVQFDNVVQVSRLTFLGDDRYRDTAMPANCVCHSNPAQLYPINSFAFWWTDPMHPLLGERTRAILAVVLLLGVASSAWGLVRLLREPPNAVYPGVTSQGVARPARNSEGV